MENVTFAPCPQCRSDEIVLFEASPRDGYGRASIGVSAFKSIPLARLVCLQCGSVREWIADPDNLNFLRKKYGRMPR